MDDNVGRMATPSVDSPSVPMPSAKVRAAVSLLVAVHLFAVFLGPWSMPPATSELAGSFAQVYRPYLDSLCLANGYRFFAPEPGPSHLIRYEITRDDGSQTEGIFPDRNVNKPRLLYHRYFMLSEFMNTLYNPNAPGDERAQAYIRSYAQHLADEYHAREVKLYLRRHYVPRMKEVQGGMRLSDKALYSELPLVTYTRDEP